MRDVLDKWMLREKICKILKFPNTFWFIIISGMFWQNFTTISQICIPYEFAQSGCLPPKIKCETLVREGSRVR